MIKNNQDHINKTYASLILAEKEKNIQNYDVELNNLIKGHQYFIEKKKKLLFKNSIILQIYYHNLLKKLKT